MAGRRRKRNPFRGIRTLIVSRRGGGSSSQGGAGVSGDYSFYAAAVPGGKGILQIAIVNGQQQAPVIVPMFSLEPFNYAVGALPLLVGGFGWDAGGLVISPYASIAGKETFETYAIGAANEADLIDGTGWNGGAALPQPYVRNVGVEDFESYAAGATSGSALTAGSGWSGDTGLFAY